LLTEYKEAESKAKKAFAELAGKEISIEIDPQAIQLYTELRRNALNWLNEVNAPDNINFLLITYSTTIIIIN
jgi:hypothetical protein